MDPHSKTVLCWICLQVIFASVLSDVWKAEVEPKIEALVSSCVVLPCKFNYPGTELPSSRLKGIWHEKSGKERKIYDEDSLNIADSFKDRTKLIGQLSKKNCSLEIDDVKDHDNGPFCFRIEIPGRDKFSFVEQCVDIIMKSEPDKPHLDKEESFVEGTPAIFKCSVKHTCPTHQPTIEWSRKDVKTRSSYRDQGHGVWEVESLFTFTTTEQDDHTNITCTVTYYGDRKTAVTSKIYVKRKENFFHIIIPVVAVFGTVILFGTACFFVTKRYKQQIQDLQSRNPNGVWSRLSRMSHRVRSVGWMRSVKRSLIFSQLN
ncbi:sialic acid-binding Ig-like lectin 14 [Clarias gariepinus]|uniref:myelin-associated glycoprotein-like n=1 Tax=Clarias gariepinus TaxID=13013 RepID=UPI00234C92A4|nr:myelin-associated glycoprotein-like [Clarias gariepinus]